MSQPNIIYFLSDQHNVALSAFMGHPLVETPNMDRLAGAGVVMDNCYCNSPLCVPSRTAMLSGVLPNRTGVLNNMQMYPSDQVTVAHSMTNAGYETVLCGRMHFSGYDQWHGFEKRLVGDTTSSFPGMDNEPQMYGILRGASNQSRVALDWAGKGCSTVLKYDESVVEAACDHILNRKDQRPLFMVVGSYGPHCPYVAYEKWFDYYYEKLTEQDIDLTKTYHLSEHPAMQQWIALRKLEEVSEDCIRNVRAAYYAMISITDENLGKVMDAAAQGLDMDNTVLVYTSDHGDNAGEHGLFWKTNFFEGSARVPAIFSCPSRFKSGARINGLCSLIDLAPTFIELGEGKKLPYMDGMSLVHTLTTGEALPERSVISILGDIKGDNPSAMIRKGPYKMIVHYGYDDPQLYHLEQDSCENVDLGTNPDYAHIVTQLGAELSEYWNADKAYADLRLAKEHFAMLKDWINHIGWDPLFEYDAKAEDNYVLK